MTKGTPGYLYNKKAEARELAKDLLRTQRQPLEILHKLLGHLHESRDALESAIKSLESYDSDSDTERLLSELRQKLHDVKREISVKNELKNELSAVDLIGNLEEFNWKSLPDGLIDLYVMQAMDYESTKNFHYVLEIFALLVRNGVSPPAWVLKDVADRVAKYLNAPGRPPEVLIKQFGLAGEASGAVNPRDQQGTRRQRSMMMIEMAALIRDFELPQDRAARAIILKYGLSQSASTVKRWFKGYFGDLIGHTIDPKNQVVMTEYERTQFVTSFPPSARKLFRKSNAR